MSAPGFEPGVLAVAGECAIHQTIVVALLPMLKLSLFLRW